jgi:glutamyl-tRNA reductase
MAEADILIGSTSCPHTILSRVEAEHLIRGRESRPLVIVDIALTRDIDGARGEGVFLYDLDDLR